jgi:hypothetical protein
MLHLKNALCAMVLCAPISGVLTGCIHTPPNPDMRDAVSSPALAAGASVTATVPILLDDRVYVELSFTRPDGTPRKAIALVNMGSAPLILSNALFREFQPTAGKPLHLQVGTLDIAVDGGAVQPETMAFNAFIGINPFAHAATAEEMAAGPGGIMKAMTAPLNVEAVLPAGVLQHFQVVLDYGAKTLTLASPGAIKPEGVAVPVRLNAKTGFVMADVAVDGETQSFVLDCGGSFSAARDTLAWRSRHPEWLRSVGGIGPANLVGLDGFEAVDPVLKIPGASLGGLTLDELGVMEIGPQSWFGRYATGALFWDRIYSDKAGETVYGWIGGNVMKSYRLTIDYPAHMTYWMQQAPIDKEDLNQVGIVLGRYAGVTVVAGIAQKDGAPAVTHVQSGDKLLKIDGVETSSLKRGELLRALHGKPGDHKRLLLERDGKELEIDTSVTAF